MVRFPVDAFLSRIQRLAEDTAAAVAAAASASHPSGPPSSSISDANSTYTGPWASIRSLPPSDVIAAVQHTLFRPQQQALEVMQQQQQQRQRAVHQEHAQEAWYQSIRCAGFQVPRYGRSNLPKQSMLDHPGVWEDARMAYLQEVLVRKTGSPAALVILYAEVYRQLLLMGAIDFAVTFDYG